MVGVAKTARLSLQVIYKDAMYHDRLTPLAEISLGVYYQDTQDIHIGYTYGIRPRRLVDLPNAKKINQ